MRQHIEPWDVQTRDSFAAILEFSWFSGSVGGGLPPTSKRALEGLRCSESGIGIAAFLSQAMHVLYLVKSIQVTSVCEFFGVVMR